MRASVAGFVCLLCKSPCVRKHVMQKYCSSCSEIRDRERKRLWFRSHPLTRSQLDKRMERNAELREATIKAGAKMSEGQSIAWDTSTPKLSWIIRIAIPFSYAFSKNHIYALVHRGHIALRKESKKKRDALTTLFADAIRQSGRKIVRNKLWVDLLVQKPDHRGDAINVLDCICDGLRHATGLDDRWFCVRKLDWEIVKTEPRIYVGIGQEDCAECIVCSTCGRILDLERFCRNSYGPSGRHRVCRECMSAGRLAIKSIKE